MTTFEDQMRSAIVKALEAKHNPEKVELIKYEVAAGSNKGDNFSCELKSVSTTAKINGNKTVEDKLMVKHNPANETRTAWIKAVRIQG